MFYSLLEYKVHAVGRCIQHLVVANFTYMVLSIHIYAAMENSMRGECVCSHAYTNLSMNYLSIVIVWFYNGFCNYWNGIRLYLLV